METQLDVLCFLTGAVFAEVFIHIKAEEQVKLLLQFERSLWKVCTVAAQGQELRSHAYRFHVVKMKKNFLTGAIQDQKSISLGFQIKLESSIKPFLELVCKRSRLVSSDQAFVLILPWWLTILSCCKLLRIILLLTVKLWVIEEFRQTNLATAKMVRLAIWMRLRSNRSKWVSTHEAWMLWIELRFGPPWSHDSINLKILVNYNP